MDSFLFIGATLVSYLLLKDLDKSNGWFHGKGGVRMFLFYLNRYLRLSIPYALAIGVYVGVIPLLLAGGPIASSNLAWVEVNTHYMLYKKYEKKTLIKLLLG